MSGRQLGRYRIRSKIGAGGMGEVYLAHDTHLDRDVALKVLRGDSILDQNARKRLLAEARAASRLNHPNICIVHEAGETDGEVFIAMEYVEGRRLSDIIYPSGIPSEKVVGYGLQLIAALAHAHERGIIHRDLKPANIIITPQDCLKLLDFGLAQRTSAQSTSIREQDETTTVSAALQSVDRACTLSYAAPEILGGTAANASSDIWSLGIVFYEMATGTLPFVGHTVFELTSAILNQRCPVLPASTPAGLNLIVQRCLEKQPLRRYQRATEVRAALEAVSHASASESSQAFVHGDRKFFNRRMLLVAAVTIATLGVWLDIGPLPTRVLVSKSVAVLPLKSLSSASDQEYFTDGMTDQLITELGSISALRVISRTSTMHYKDTRQTVPEIAQHLNVAAVVQGSVLRSGNHVRITVQLTDGKTDRNLWAQSYEREMEDIFRLQAEVASAIASEVQATLTPQERAHLLRNVKVDPEAYQLYLRGRFFWEQRTPEGFQKALARFHDAISKDPTYAQAYCGLADTYILQENYGSLSFEEAHSLAQAAAVRAVELDSTLAEAHTSLASIRQDYDWDWAASESEYRRAIELNPSYATAHQWYGNLLSVLGRHNEAILHGSQARQLAPLSARIAVDLGYVFFHARQYDKAIQEGLKALELEPNLASSHELLGRAYLSKNLGTKAIAEFQAAAALTQNNKTDRALLAYSYAKTGRKDLALKTVSELSSVPSSSVPFYRIAMIYVALDQKQSAMLTLEQAFSSKHDKWLQLIGVEEAFDPLRSQPRFQAIVTGLQLTK